MYYFILVFNNFHKKSIYVGSLLHAQCVAFSDSLRLEEINLSR